MALSEQQIQDTGDALSDALWECLRVATAEHEDGVPAGLLAGALLYQVIRLVDKGLLTGEEVTTLWRNLTNEAAMRHPLYYMPTNGMAN